MKRRRSEHEGESLPSAPLAKASRKNSDSLAHEHDAVTAETALERKPAPLPDNMHSSRAARTLEERLADAPLAQRLMTRFYEGVENHDSGISPISHSIALPNPMVEPLLAEPVDIGTLEKTPVPSRSPSVEIIDPPLEEPTPISIITSGLGEMSTVSKGTVLLEEQLEPMDVSPLSPPAIKSINTFAQSTMGVTLPAPPLQQKAAALVPVQATAELTPHYPGLPQDFPIMSKSWSRSRVPLPPQSSALLQDAIMQPLIPPEPPKIQFGQSNASTLPFLADSAAEQHTPPKIQPPTVEPPELEEGELSEVTADSQFAADVEQLYNPFSPLVQNAMQQWVLLNPLAAHQIIHGPPDSALVTAEQTSTYSAPLHTLGPADTYTYAYGQPHYHDLDDPPSLTSI